MKKLLLLLPFLLLLLNCGKRDDELNNELYVGTWNWKSTNYATGTVFETPESTGIVKKLALTENYHYTVTENGEVTKEGSYSLENGVTNTDHTEKTFLVFSDKSEKIVMQVDATNLILADDTTEGLTYRYQK